MLQTVIRLSSVNVQVKKIRDDQCCSAGLVYSYRKCHSKMSAGLQAKLYMKLDVSSTC